ncbi:hypothetical protein K3M67_21365 (plasmid) [Sphingobium sp. V4]|uniref:hypothetical protein n=1 Tax=Sphingobium sp. V4 TaxID=3038927 RepID=UPI002558171E|nr:hypothetical protein [Sphingobium sp. V4]WIW90553.1 hypothetical protein K3M67_21365 [Sphingobium sp. V4]
MSLATFSNAILMLLCMAVIVQTLRLSRSVRELRSSALHDSVAQLERATGQARAVLGELKMMLATEVVAQSRAAASSEALRDELSVMVGIGNAVAERILEAVAAQNEAKAAEPAKPARRQGSRKARSRTASGKGKQPTNLVLLPSVTADTRVAGHA